VTGLLASLSHPEWALPATLAWLVVALAVLWAARRGRRALALLLGAAPHTLTASAARRDTLLLVAAALIAVALLGPRFGTETLRLPATGMDVVVLVDVSRSMDATDVAPSRLVRARHLAGEVLQRLRSGDRAALAVFAGHGALLTPLTSDTRALAEFLTAFDTSLMSDPGSRMWEGVSAALPAFDASGLRPRALLVLSDGEGGNVLPLATGGALREAEVRVFGVGLGTEAGGTIPAAGGVLREADGGPVTTRRSLRGLAAVSDATGGVLMASDGFGNVDVPALVDELRRDARPTAEGMVERQVPSTHVALPAALALALLLLEWAAPPAAWRRSRDAQTTPRRHGLRVAGLAALALPFLLGAGPSDGTLRGLEARVQAHPEDVNALLALGVARAEAGELADAGHAFLAAAARAKQPQQAALAYYDLGVAALEQGDLEGARSAFFDALALDPSDRHARFNLEWTLAALASPPPPPPEAPSQSEPEDGEEGEAEDEAERESDEAAEEGAPDEAQPEDGDASGSTAPMPSVPQLGEEEAERWLDAVDDDPRSALRAIAGEGDPKRARPGPRW
jgi:Ca-activated chloride channel family protein